jgi:GYF domain 2
MIEQIYVEQRGRKYGPFSATQLRALASAGKLRPTDNVWKEGMEKAVLAAKVKNLFLSIQTPPCPLAVPVATSTEAASAPIASDASSLSYLDGSTVSVFTHAPPKELSETADKNAATVPCQEISSRTGQSAEHHTDLNTKPPVRHSEKPRMRRAVAVQGAVLVSQDGHSVHYRKVCSQCRSEDNCRSTMLISTGITRSHFFCPKCRKNREVLIQGTMQ